MAPWLQFGLQFNTVQGRPPRTQQARWSSLNRSEPLCGELLMRMRLEGRSQGQVSLTVF
jgi:hypothetical protein